MKRVLPLLLVRHAEAQHHVHEVTGGWTDAKLTEMGLRQAGLLAERLKRELPGVTLFLASSELQRARQTAGILGQALGVEPHFFAELKDLNNGAAAGKSKAEARLLATPPQEPFVDWQPYPDAEIWRQFYERISCFMEALLVRDDLPGVGKAQELEDAALILVTHAAVIQVVLNWWLSLEVEAMIRIEVTPTSLTVLRVNRRGERMIERLNDTAHLYVAGIIDHIRL